MSPHRRRSAGLVVIRVWLEDSSSSMRAHVTQLVDVERGKPVVTTATSIDQVTEIVRTFLAEYVREGGPQGSGGTRRPWGLTSRDANGDALPTIQ